MPECSEGTATVNREVVVVVVVVMVMELYFTLYHGCYVRVLLLSSHEWVTRYWTIIMCRINMLHFTQYILSFVKRSHFVITSRHWLNRI